MRCRRSCRRSRPAVAAAELALLLPTLVILSLGTLDVCRVLFGYLTLADCARNGALYASCSTTMEQASPYYNSADADYTAGTQRAAQADAGNLSPALTNTNIVLTYATTYNGTYGSTRPTPIDSTHDGYAKVTITWTYTTTINYPLLPHTLAMSRSATMRIAPPPS